MKCASFAGCRFHPDPALMQLHYLLTMRQPDTRTRIFIAGVELLKNNKYPFVIFFCYSNTIVFKCKLPIATDFLHRNIYLRRNSFFPELNSINNQVLKKLFDLREITIDNGKLLRFNLDRK